MGRANDSENYENLNKMESIYTSRICRELIKICFVAGRLRPDFPHAFTYIFPYFLFKYVIEFLIHVMNKRACTIKFFVIVFTTFCGVWCWRGEHRVPVKYFYSFCKHWIIYDKPYDIAIRWVFWWIFAVSITYATLVSSSRCHTS